MPESIIRYACSLCGNEYDTKFEALQCEQLGFPTEHNDKNVGDILQYENEESGMGVRWSYSWHSDEILHKTIINQGGKHAWAFIVLQKYLDTPFCERMVFECETTHGGKHLFSPAEQNYKLGFADHMKQITN